MSFLKNLVFHREKWLKVAFLQVSDSIGVWQVRSELVFIALGCQDLSCIKYSALPDPYLMIWTLPVHASGPKKWQGQKIGVGSEVTTGLRVMISPEPPKFGINSIMIWINFSQSGLSWIGPGYIFDPRGSLWPAFWAFFRPNRFSSSHFGKSWSIS